VVLLLQLNESETNDHQLLELGPAHLIIKPFEHVVSSLLKLHPALRRVEWTRLWTNIHCTSNQIQFNRSLLF